MATPVRMRATLRLAAALATASAAAGCAFVPRAQLDDCHKLSRTLQAETARLKDANVSLRSRERDLAERSVDDARRIAALEEANQRLESSILAYQQDRDRLAAAFDRIQADLQAPPSPQQARRD